MKNMGAYLGIAFELTGLIIVFLYLGRYIDRKMEWDGIGIAVGVIFALVLWVIHLMILVKKWEKQDLES